MAWIESHQQLRDHPKVLRLARLLDVHRTSAVGLLHFLWWWALDHAEDGDLSDFDVLDIALAAGWEGDPATFVKALEDCGPGDRCGFLAYDDGRLVLHDWMDYAGKLVERRVKDRERKKAERQKSDAGPKEVQRTSDGSPGVQNRTEPNPTKDRAPADADDVSASFERFWNAYPRGQAGKMGGDGPKKPAKQRWRRLKPAEREACLVAVEHYRAHVNKPGGPHAAHAVTWLNQERWEQWQEPGSSTPQLGKLGTGGVPPERRSA